MKKVIDFYKNILPLIVLIIYAVGYVFLTNYYANFGIDIIYYLSLTDILFFSLGMLITLAIILFIVEFGLSFLMMIFSKEKQSDKEDQDEDVKDKAGKSFIKQLVSTFILIVIVFLLAHYTEYDFYLYTILFTLMPIKISSSMRAFGEEDKKFQDFEIIFTGSFVTVTLIVVAFLYGNYEAKNVKNINSDIFYNKIEFTFENVQYSTFENDTLVFIGQTTDDLFVYNTITKKSTVFIKNNLKDIKFYDPAVLTEKEKNEVRLWNSKFNKIFSKNKKTN